MDFLSGRILARFDCIVSKYYPFMIVESIIYYCICFMAHMPLMQSAYEIVVC